MKMELIDVSKKLSGHFVVKDISMTLESGQVIGLRGVNGSGKTMLLRLMAGLIYPTIGHVMVDGKELGKDISFPESIGILIESPSFLNAYTGYQNLSMLAGIRGCITEKRIRQVLESVGLKENADKRFKKYSLGMKQRLGIAAAVMENPDIVLLDEPTNALDEEGVKMLHQIVEEQKLRGALVVIASHDAIFLEEAADTIHWLENGSVREGGK